MNDFTLEDILHEEQTKIIYVYDFFNMWTFLVELGAIEEKVDGASYPVLLFSHGVLPSEAPEKEFEADDFGADFNDGDDFDMFDGDDSFEDFGFDENWN